MFSLHCDLPYQPNEEVSARRLGVACLVVLSCGKRASSAGIKSREPVWVGDPNDGRTIGTSGLTCLLDQVPPLPQLPSTEAARFSKCRISAEKKAFTSCHCCQEVYILLARSRMAMMGVVTRIVKFLPPVKIYTECLHAHRLALGSRPS